MTRKFYEAHFLSSAPCSSVLSPRQMHSCVVLVSVSYVSFDVWHRHVECARDALRSWTMKCEGHTIACISKQRKWNTYIKKQTKIEQNNSSHQPNNNVGMRVSIRLCSFLLRMSLSLSLKLFVHRPRAVYAVHGISSYIYLSFWRRHLTLSACTANTPHGCLLKGYYSRIESTSTHHIHTHTHSYNEMKSRTFFRCSGKPLFVLHLYGRWRQLWLHTDYAPPTNERQHKIRTPKNAFKGNNAELFFDCSSLCLLFDSFY